jgi:hypothetical protein
MSLFLQLQTLVVSPCLPDKPRLFGKLIIEINEMIKLDDAKMYQAKKLSHAKLGHHIK